MQCIKFETAGAADAGIAAVLETVPNEDPFLLLHAGSVLCPDASKQVRTFVSAPRVQWAHLGSASDGLYMRRGSHDVGRELRTPAATHPLSDINQDWGQRIVSYLLAKEACAAEPYHVLLAQRGAACGENTAHMATFSADDAELAAHMTQACARECSAEPSLLRCHNFTTCNSISPLVGCAQDEDFCVHKQMPACRLQDTTAFITNTPDGCTACY